MGPFKQTVRKYRQSLFKSGHTYIQVYNLALAYKLRGSVTDVYQKTESDITHPSQL